MSEFKEMRAKIKAYKKNKYPNTKGVYMSGIPSWREGNAFYIFLDTDNEELEMINFADEASLPLNRIKEAASITEKEVEEYEKNSLTKGLVTTALIGPLAGLIVGLNKQKKKKTSYFTFLSIVYEDKEGNENTLIFRTPSTTNTSLYFKKFLKFLKPYLPETEEEQIKGKIEL